MKRNPLYLLKSIGAKQYLIASGQLTADFKQEYELNETSAFLWECLAEEINLTSLLEKCSQHFNVSFADGGDNFKHIVSYLAFLKNNGLISDKGYDTYEFHSCKQAKIAGITIQFWGNPSIFPSHLSSFVTQESPSDLSYVQRVFAVPSAPIHAENGQLLLRNENLYVMKNDEKYILLFPTFPTIKEVHLSIDGKNAFIHYDGSITNQTSEEIFHAMKLVFYYFAQTKGFLALHSASILRNDKALLFSAPSQTGKSTQARHWQQLFNTPILNGDINLLGKKDNAYYVFGTPWCGTSETFTAKDYPLGEIVLLSQGKTDEMVQLSNEQKILYTFHRCISPNWEEPLLDYNLTFCQELSKEVPIYKLSCTKEASAAEFLNNHLSNS